MTTLCHSVRSWRLPSLSFQLSLVAIRMLTTSPPLFSDRASGSAPRLPIRITLFTPAMSLSIPVRKGDNAAARDAPVLSRNQPPRRPPVPGEAGGERQQGHDLHRDALQGREKSEHGNPRQRGERVDRNQARLLQRGNALAGEYDGENRNQRRAQREEFPDRQALTKPEHRHGDAAQEC